MTSRNRGSTPDYKIICTEYLGIPYSTFLTLRYPPQKGQKSGGYGHSRPDQVQTHVQWRSWGPSDPVTE